jgi:hypothetical protein
MQYPGYLIRVLVYYRTTHGLFEAGLRPPCQNSTAPFNTDLLRLLARRATPRGRGGVSYQPGALTVKDERKEKEIVVNRKS